MRRQSEFSSPSVNVRPSGDEVIMDPMTDFLTGYVVPAGAGLAGDPGGRSTLEWIYLSADQAVS